MSDEHLDDTIRELARDYRSSEKPLDAARREEMWEAIAARRGHSDSAPKKGRVVASNLRRWWPAAAAALLLLGVGIGRILPESGPGPLETAVEPSSSGEVRWKQTTAEALYRLAARGYLRRTQTELTRYQLASSDPSAAEGELPMTDWAGALLVRTRIFLDSPLSADPSMRELLEDLEVVLARIVQSSDDANLQEEAFILEGMRRQGILERLQEQVPEKNPTRKPAADLTSQPATGT